MNAWSHLPNARHIDWVIESVKDNPGVWVAAQNAARDEARDAARDAARNAAWNAAWDAARHAAWNAAWNVDRVAAWFVLTALVAYDDCDMYLSMSYDELRVWALLSETPQAVLLLPLKWVQENCKSDVVQQFDNKCTL